jgi:hypothetical protein
MFSSTKSGNKTHFLFEDVTNLIKIVSGSLISVLQKTANGRYSVSVQLGSHLRKRRCLYGIRAPISTLKLEKTQGDASLPDIKAKCLLSS